MIPGAPKTDNDSYFDQTKPHIKTLIKNQLKETGPAKTIMILWIIDNYIRVEMPFKSLMTEVFKGSHINDLIQRMLAHIKTQVENPQSWL